MNLVYYFFVAFCCIFLTFLSIIVIVGGTTLITWFATYLVADVIDLGILWKNKKHALELPAQREDED